MNLLSIAMLSLEWLNTGCCSNLQFPSFYASRKEIEKFRFYSRVIKSVKAKSNRKVKYCSLRRKMLIAFAFSSFQLMFPIFATTPCTMESGKISYLRSVKWIIISGICRGRRRWIDFETRSSIPSTLWRIINGRFN